MLHLHKSEAFLCWIGLGGKFLWVWITEGEISAHSTNFCWVGYAGKMPASNILYNILRVQEDERRARIVNPAERNYGCSRD
jgi:hypothetical protein